MKYIKLKSGGVYEARYATFDGRWAIAHMSHLWKDNNPVVVETEIKQKALVGLEDGYRYVTFTYVELDADWVACETDSPFCPKEWLVTTKNDFNWQVKNHLHCATFKGKVKLVE